VVVAGPLETPCWLWRGRLTGKGYASRGDKSGSYLVHRRVLEEHDDRPLRDGEQIHHRCEQKSCVNPDHLERTTALGHNRIHFPDAIAERTAGLLGDGAHYRAVAEALGVDRVAVRVALHRAVSRGEVRRVGRGLYAAETRRRDAGPRNHPAASRRLKTPDLQGVSE
jgi:hypothetical protein